jgi:muramoyltetrapeptide carboxypeptidase
MWAFLMGQCSMFIDKIKNIAGKKIGVFAPSSCVDTGRFEAGLDIIHARGFETVVHPQCFAKDHQSAGTTAQKVAALHDLARNDDVGLIMAAAGGNRALHMLEGIDYELFTGSNKLYCGYSDSTALSFALRSQGNLSSMFGPMVQNLAALTSADQGYFFDTLSGKAPPYILDNTIDVVKLGQVSGELIGGTLALICSLVGTDYMPQINGQILYIEDCFEELSRIDRMLGQLKLALPFSRLGGLIVGQFTDIQDNGAPFGFSLADIIGEHSAAINGPVIMNAPFGHGERLQSLAFGVQANLKVSKDAVTIKATLKF